MLKSTKVFVAVGSLLCTAASFSIAVSPALTETARQMRAVVISARAVSADAGLRAHAAPHRPAVVFETPGDACRIVSADRGLRHYAANTQVQMFDLVEQN